MIYKKESKIIQCYHTCPFFTVNGNTMECGHPCFDGRDPYESLIITQENSKGRVPDECPIKKDGVTETVLRVVLM